MDFFEHQDKARKNTRLLVVYFVIAVACIIASVYLASLLIFYGTQSQQQPMAPSPALVLWDPELFLYSVLGTLSVVIIGSLYKTAVLVKGGSAVAEALGGRPCPGRRRHRRHAGLQQNLRVGEVKPPLSRLPIQPFPRLLGERGSAAANVVQMGAMLLNLGRSTQLHLRYAEELRNSFSEKVQSAALWPEVAPVATRARLPLVRDCSITLSALANASSSSDGEVAQAFQMGAPRLRAKANGLQLLSRAESRLEPLDTALDRVALSTPQIKKNLLEACVHVVGADGVIQEREVELLRAIADTLDCPIPPFVEIAAS